MKRMILTFLIFLSINLYAEKLSGIFENKNSKGLDSLFEQVRMKFSLDKYSNMLDNYKRAINIDNTFVDTEGYAYTFRTFGLEGFNKIFLFRINHIYDENYEAVKNLGLKKGTYGVIIVNTLYKLGDEKFKVFIHLGHENEFDRKVCLAPYKKSDFKIDNPTCKDKWNMYAYQRSANLVLQGEYNLLKNDLSEIEEKQFMIDAAKHMVEFGINPYDKSTKEVLKYSIGESLSLVVPDNKEANEVMAGILANFAVDAGTQVLIGGVTLPSAIAGDVVTIGSKIWGIFDVATVQHKRQDIEIAQIYLNRFYAYGSSQSKVATSLGLNANATIRDIIAKIAKDKKFINFTHALSSNLLYMAEYRSPYANEIIRKISQNIVPRNQSKCINNPGLKDYIYVDKD